MHFVRRRATPLALTVLLLLSIAAVSCNRRDARSFRQPPPIVNVVRAIRKTVPIRREFLGQTVAVNVVEIHSQVTGLLRKVAFREGSTVEPGQLLFTIDPRSYQAAFNQAKAKLAQTEAVLENSQRNLARDRVLFRRKVLSRQQFDTQTAETKEAEANVEAAKAAVDTAHLNLSYTRIYAPIKGRIGTAQVKVGGLVQKNTTLLDTIYSINPIYVDFSVAEASYLNFEESKNENDPAPLSGLELILPNGSVYPNKGSIMMTYPTVDPGTGTIKLRAEFPNPKGWLRSGLFVRVRAIVGEKTDAVLVPEQAIQRLQGQQSIYVVGKGDRVEFRNIKPGPTVNHMQVVASGVKSGERVIVEGQQKVRPGMKVVPVLKSVTNHTHSSQAARKS